MFKKKESIQGFVGGSIIALIFYALIHKKAAFKTIKFSNVKVTGFAWDGLTPVLPITINANNTSNQEFTLNAISADVYCEDYKVGTIESFFQQKILKVSSTPVSLIIRLNLIGIVNDIIASVVEKHFTKELTIKGYANIDNFQIPIEETFLTGI